MIKKGQTATLRLLAQKLNIHVSTVSRVLNGTDADAVKAASQSTIARIRLLAAEYDYKPNPHAICLRKKQSKLVGVLVPRLSDYIWASVYEGIEGAALDEGYCAYVTNSHEEKECQRRQVELAEARRVDGLVLGDACNTPEAIEALGRLALPFVLVLRRAGDFLSVTGDDYQGGRMAARHLFERGHREVGVIAGETYVLTGQERTAGFIDFYREAGFPVAPERIVHSTFDPRGGRESAQRLLGGHRSLTGLFVVSDMVAIGAMGAMRDIDVVPGHSMALVGYNDTPLTAELPVPLTTLRPPLRKIGERAMGVLLRHLQGEPCCSERLPPELVIRESSSFEGRL